MVKAKNQSGALAPPFVSQYDSEAWPERPAPKEQEREL